MIQKIKKKLIVLASVLTLLAPVGLTTTAVYAQTVQQGINKNLICGSDANLNIDQNQACPITEANNQSLSDKIKKIINIFSAIVGVIAVFMIIYGGLRYVASGGKQESVTSAKNTLLYAVIGLIIVALAQAIVHFVLNTATT